MRRLSQGSVTFTAWSLAGLGLILGAGIPDFVRTASLQSPDPGSEVSLATGSPAVPSPTLPSPALTAVVRRYCVVCHNDALLTGNLSLQHFAVEQAPGERETAEKMIRKLRAGMMPPPGIPRPSADTLLSLVETLESSVDEAARTAPNLGTRRFQRLSRPEYERVVHELLGLEVKADNWLPADLLVGSFDNMSAAQGLSTTLLDSYLKAAIDVSRLAIGNPQALSSTTKHLNPMEVSQHAWDQIEGAPFGTRGGMVVTHDFPADGEYVFRVETDFGSGNQVAAEDIDISVDGEPVALLRLEYNAARTVPAIATEPIFVRAGQRRVSAAFVNLIEGPYEDRFSPATWSKAGTAGENYGVTGLTHLKELLITGPGNISGVAETESRRRIFTCRPSVPEEARPCAQSILSRLAARAYRRPLPADDIVDLMSFYDAAAAEGGFETGVQMGLQAILVSPGVRLPAGA